MLLCYSISNRNTFESLGNWLNEVNEHCPPDVMEGKEMMKNLTSYRELREQWTIDSLTNLGDKGLVNVSRNWEHVQNNTWKLTSINEEVEEICEVVPLRFLVSLDVTFECFFLKLSYSFLLGGF